jgi:Tfp pilus assembly protein PilX
MLKRTRDRGVTILTVLVLVIIIAGISSAFFLLALNESSTSEKTRYKARAMYLAEAGAEVAASDLRIACATDASIITSVGSVSPTAPVPPATGAPVTQTAWANKGSGLPVNWPVPLAGVTTAGLAKTVYIDGFPVQYNVYKRSPLVQSNDAKTGLNSDKSAFEIMAYARVGEDAQKSQGSVKAQEGIVYRTVETVGTPLFQFLAFYANDLEMNPGPFAHFHGRIHANADLYITDRDTSRGMIIDSNYVQAAGNMFRTYAATGGAAQVETGANGPIYVRQAGTTPKGDSIEDANPANDPGLVQWNLGFNSQSSNWATQSQSNWNGSVKDGQTGGGRLIAPPLDSIGQGGTYQGQAQSGGLEIKNTPTGPQVLASGTDVTSAINSAQPGTISTSTIWDAREGKNVPVITVNVGKLMKSGYRPSNGMIYASDVNATATSPTGVQLTNGGYIAPSSGAVQGLTVVSPLPVYVTGDYNGHTDTSTGLTTKRQVFNSDGSPKLDTAGNPVFQTQSMDPNTGGLVDTQPCAIMADAVNLLSNAWNGSKTASSGVPGASNTTYNFAMVANNQQTKSDASLPDNGYNGGLQNLPRFHEDWGGIKCNIAGAFVNLWRSQIATGQYGKGGVYVPPERHWDYDQSFEVAGKTPPGAPMAMSIGRTTYEEGAVRSGKFDATGKLIPGAYDLLPGK